jgi:hypothetical protein
VLEFVYPVEQETYELVRLLTPLIDGSIKEIIRGSTIIIAYDQGHFCRYCRSFQTCLKPPADIARKRELFNYLSAMRSKYH